VMHDAMRRGDGAGQICFLAMCGGVIG